MTRRVLMIGLGVSAGLSAQAAAQPTWNPFDEVSGTITLTGAYCYPCPDPDTIVQTSDFLLGQGGSLMMDTSTAVAEPNTHGVLLSADWKQAQDIHIIPGTPQPLHEIDAYEWSFEIGAQAIDDDFPLTGSVSITVDVVLNEFVEVMLLAETRSDTFSAEIGDLVANVKWDPSSTILQSGTLSGDGRYLKSTLLAPGTHRLRIHGKTWSLHDAVHDSDGTVLVRFSRACGGGPADLNRDGVLDQGDIGLFVALFLAGC